MVTYKIIYDITQDAYNWFNAINNFGGIKKLKDAQDIEVAEKIMGLKFFGSKEDSDSLPRRKKCTNRDDAGAI